MYRVDISITSFQTPEKRLRIAPVSSGRLLKNSQDTQAAQKGADARRIRKRLRRRTGKYADEAARQATKPMRLFQQPASLHSSPSRKGALGVRRAQQPITSVSPTSVVRLSTFDTHVNYFLVIVHLILLRPTTCWGLLQTNRRW